jgi:hypothetical protein
MTFLRDERFFWSRGEKTAKIGDFYLKYPQNPVVTTIDLVWPKIIKLRESRHYLHSALGKRMGAADAEGLPL